MKKKKINFIVVIILILALIPIPMKLKDGGSVEYKAILYEVKKYHTINTESTKGYDDGLKIKILGLTIYDKINTYIETENNDDGSKSYENSKDCCENCICGDTIELLKKVETAWTLTEINSKGEYKYIKDSFINFHGTGKNKFAFFKGNKEVKGEFTINKNNEIILIPNDEKYSKTTCKLGKEKDLIAVMNCDNNFGTFTLQKEGTIELPNIIKDTISKTKSIKVKGHQTITEEKQINTIISIINSSKVWTGAVTLPSPKYEIELFDVNNNNIAKILYNPDHYFNIEINKKRYELTNRQIRYILRRLAKSEPNVDYKARYMIAQLIYPHYIEQYEQNPEKATIKQAYIISKETGIPYDNIFFDHNSTFGR